MTRRHASQPCTLESTKTSAWRVIAAGDSYCRDSCEEKQEQPCTCYRSGSFYREVPRRSQREFTEGYRYCRRWSDVTWHADQTQLIDESVYLCKLTDCRQGEVPPRQVNKTIRDGSYDGGSASKPVHNRLRQSSIDTEARSKRHPFRALCLCRRRSWSGRPNILLLHQSTNLQSASTIVEW